jgi:Terminase small subunit
VTGCRLLRNPKVAEAIRARRGETERRLEMDRQKVLQRLQEAIEMARMKGDPGAMIRGWVEIAKMCGYYARCRRLWKRTNQRSLVRPPIEAENMRESRQAQ